MRLRTHGPALQVEPMGVVDEAIEDGIGQGRVADDIVPLLDRQLAGDDGGAAPVAVLLDLQQFAPLDGRQWFRPPGVQDQQLGLGHRAQEALVPAIAATYG